MAKKNQEEIAKETALVLKEINNDNKQNQDSTADADANAADPSSQSSTCAVSNNNEDENDHHPYAFHVSGPRNVSSPSWREIIKSSWYLFCFLLYALLISFKLFNRTPNFLICLVV